jgi:hypothetical protein
MRGRRVRVTSAYRWRRCRGGFQRELFPTRSPPSPLRLYEARKLIASGAAVLVDVLEQHEWDAGHAAEAVHMPIGELDAAERFLDSALRA